MLGREDEMAVLACTSLSTFVGLGLGGAKTSSSGAIDIPNKLGEPESVRRCASPLKGDVCAVIPVADAAEDAGPVEAED